MTISVIMPAWNNSLHVEEALASIFEQKDFDGELQVILVDDGSTDDTAARAERRFSKLTCVRKEHSGISRTLNAGLERARGEFIAFLDADDVWPEGSLASRARAFREDPDLEIAAGHVRQFVSPESRTAGTACVHTQPVPGFLMGALLVRSDAFFRVGVFDEAVSSAQGVDWYLRARDMNLKTLLSPQIVLHRRVHDTNHSHLGVQARLFPQILKRSLDRRRNRT